MSKTATELTESQHRFHGRSDCKSPDISDEVKSSAKQKGLDLRYVTNSLRWVVYGTPVGRALMIVPRVMRAVRTSGQPLLYILPWAVASREHTNFSYQTTDASRVGLCGMVAVIADTDIQTVSAYAEELQSNAELAEHVRAVHADSERKWTSDAKFRPGRNTLHYLLVRALKSGFVVEAGVDKGLGAAIICEALRRNAAEGHTGDYLGIEYNPIQRSSIYARFPHKRGEIRHGNLPDVIRTIDRKIDLFLHDTTTEPVHVRAQLEALQGHMAPRGVIAVPWPLPQFAEYAAKNDKRLLMHKDEPVRHGYPGSRSMVLF
jgi:hypothetical protein